MMAVRLGMGKVRYAYEGFGLPVYFTTQGIIYVQGDGKKVSLVSMQWTGANPHVRILEEEGTGGRYTYGMLPKPARAFRRLVYKDLYPGIDVEYSCVAGKAGFEYTIRARPGADLDAVRSSYGGDVTDICDSSGILIMRSAIGSIRESKPICYYAGDAPGAGKDGISAVHVLKGKKRGFAFPRSYDHHRGLVIDPFVTSTLAALTGANAGKVMEVDYDNNGDVYVQGGTSTLGQIAKYDPSGNLLWTFSGTVSSIGWQYAYNYGGWTVEKTTGNVYVGIGSNGGYGGPVIRLNGSTGLYDNFKTPAFHDNDGNYGENWKMRWFCNQGTPQVMIAGGSGGIGSYDANIGILQLPTTNFISYNITGITTYPYNQDVSDFVIDPMNNDIYCILASGNTPFVNNRIYRNKYPYTAANQLWNTLSGYSVLNEDANTIYMTGDDPSIGHSNLTNSLAVTSVNLFYYDGAHLKALDKATGATVGTPLTFAGNTPLMQQGIFADECYHVFIGMNDGTVKVLRWEGTVFDDDEDPDITIPGYAGRSVYALAYDPQRNLLYAAGDGFVAALDISAYCDAAATPVSYTVSAVSVCSSISTSLSPAPPPGAVVTYTLLNGSAVISSNTTGSFTGLAPGVTYTVQADINVGCTDVTATTTAVPSPITFKTVIGNVCGGPGTGSVTVETGGIPNLGYSLDGVSFQQDSVFTGLSAGSYTITVTSGGVCTVTGQATVGTSDLTVDAGNGITSCEGVGVVLPGSTNGGSVLWTPSTGLNDTTTLHPVATPPATTKYYLKATGDGCTLVDSVIVTILPAPVADAGEDFTLCHGQDTVLHGSGGVGYSWSPSLYLNDPSVADPRITDPGHSVAYQLQVTDAAGCRSVAADTVVVTVLPQAVVFAGDDTSIVRGQPLQLHAVDVNGTGFTTYSWTPATGLDNSAIPNPLASVDGNIVYSVTASTSQGCDATASVKITVYTNADIYVPGAFTPDGNGHNDILRLIAIGMKEVKYFVIFNRWGQEVFHTANAAEGWDGRFHGDPMMAGAYVWAAEATDVSGRTILRKGTVLLIR